MKKNEQIILFVIAALAILVGYYYLLTPQIAQISLLKKNIIQKKAEIQKAKIMVSKKPQLEREFQTVRKLIKEYKKRMPGEDKIPDFLSSLTNIANEHKVKLMSINPGKLKKSGKTCIYTEYPIAIGIKGGYHQIARFVNKLENLERFVKINHISITSDKKDALKHNADIYLSIFIFQETKSK